METNTLKFTKTYTKVVDGEIRRYAITFSINDDCHNGYESFSVTGEVDRKAKNGHWYNVGGGQCWDEVYDKMTPELQNICDQHLCSWEGRPLYAIENGFYHIKNSSKDVVKHYLQLTDEETAEVMGCQSQVELYVYIIDNKIDLRWKENARKAIETLERETGLTFKSRQTEKRQDAYEKFTPEEIMAAREKMQEPGYFSMDKVNARIQEMKSREADVYLKKLFKAAAKKKIAGRIEDELSTRLSSLFMLQPELLDNVPVNDIEKIVGRITVSVDGDYPVITFGSSFLSFQDNKKYAKDFKKIAEAFVEANKSWLSENCVTVGYYGENRETIKIYDFKEV